MTEYYRSFREKVYDFLNNSTKTGAIQFADYVDSFWATHEDDLYKSSKEDVYDEVSNVLDVMILCDRFDECDEIVEHDRYCIGSKQLYQEVKKRIDRIDNPVYE